MPPKNDPKTHQIYQHESDNSKEPHKLENESFLEYRSVVDQCLIKVGQDVGTEFTAVLYHTMLNNDKLRELVENTTKPRPQNQVNPFLSQRDVVNPYEILKDSQINMMSMIGQSQQHKAQEDEYYEPKYDTQEPNQIQQEENTTYENYLENWNAAKNDTLKENNPYDVIFPDINKIVLPELQEDNQEYTIEDIEKLSELHDKHTDKQKTRPNTHILDVENINQDENKIDCAEPQNNIAESQVTKNMTYTQYQLGLETITDPPPILQFSTKKDPDKAHKQLWLDWIAAKTKRKYVLYKTTDIEIWHQNRQRSKLNGSKKDRLKSQNIELKFPLDEEEKNTDMELQSRIVHRLHQTLKKIYSKRIEFFFKEPDKKTYAKHQSSKNKQKPLSPRSPAQRISQCHSVKFEDLTQDQIQILIDKYMTLVLKGIQIDIIKKETYQIGFDFPILQLPEAWTTEKIMQQLKENGFDPKVAECFRI